MRRLIAFQMVSFAVCYRISLKNQLTDWGIIQQIQGSSKVSVPQLGPDEVPVLPDDGVL